MSVAVIGSGAVAGLAAGWLQQAGRPPAHLCARTPVEQFTITGDGAGGTSVRTVAVDGPPAGPVDWVLLTVKAQDTPSTAGWLDAHVGPDTVVVALQNGVDHGERVQPLVGAATVLPALVMASAERTSAGHVTHHMGNLLIVPECAAADRFAALLAGGPQVRQDPDFTTAAWRKLMVNVAANCITAITVRRAEVLRDDGVRALCRTILDETVLAGRAVGAALTEDDVRFVLGLYDAYPDSNGSSMYYDRLAGRPLEHALIPGAVVRAAERGGVAVPVTRAIWTLTKAISEAAEPAV